MTFQFDTSGEVYVHGIRYTLDGSAGVGPHLSPFVQGYLWFAAQALAATLRGDRLRDPDAMDGWDVDDIEEAIAFRNFAPETLAQIMEDCQRRLVARSRLGSEKDGRDFWEARQRGTWDVSFPPLTPYLGEDGKVYLREGGQ